jgi:hypothetical protein
LEFGGSIIGEDADFQMPTTKYIFKKWRW